ncbi:DUF2637 domain-containing protein [Streptomyces triticirhizae]|uniref:DUF2637 domain-containing protein n=1 Tax=Streptomyces triticirhizae TaxID=2483353 RepID=A0A3M2MAU3_9ACTN|nr:DUF2637 domain-containing protein [Streptomyces triticirhizae]RMI46727.1 DUF2637 domain-containing protein [Streptomyces triticirhizae]
MTSQHPAAGRISGWDKAAIAGLGGAGAILSFDALQQMAGAIHVRDSLTWLFPLVIDGFIAYGVRALLVNRHAPLRARAYVWLLFGVATTTSIWANALHAVRLNQQAPTAAGDLRLDDATVGVLSTVAPLALAGAVHLYILIARGADTATHQTQRDTGAAKAASPSAPSPPRSHPSPVHPGTARSLAHSRHRTRSPHAAVHHHVERIPQPARTGHRTGYRSGFAQAAAPQALLAATSTSPGSGGPASNPSAGPSAGRPPSARPRSEVDADSATGFDERVLRAARTTVQAEGRVRRDSIAGALRSQSISISNARLTALIAQLREEHTRRSS